MEYCNQTSLFFEVLPILATVILAIVGWYITLKLQEKNRKEEFKAQLKKEVYEKLIDSSQELNAAVYKLNNCTRLPKILMESTKILGNVTKDSKYIIQGEVEARKKWMDFKNESSDSRFTFTDRWLAFSSIMESWNSVVKDSSKAVQIFHDEFSVLNEKVRTYLEKLDKLDVEKWESWNWQELEVEGENLSKEIQLTHIYLHDLMVVLHNTLIGDYFEFERETRVPLDGDLKVITKGGFVAAKDMPDFKEGKLERVLEKEGLKDYL